MSTRRKLVRVLLCLVFTAIYIWLFEHVLQGGVRVPLVGVAIHYLLVWTYGVHSALGLALELGGAALIGIGMGVVFTQPATRPATGLTHTADVTEYIDKERPDGVS